MSFGNYEISAELVINNKNAQKALKETTKQLAEFKKINDKVLGSEQKKAKYQDEVAKKTEANIKKSSQLYNKEYTNIEKLTAGINQNRLAHNNLGSEIEKHHNTLKSENKTIQESTKSWKEFANARGLTYSKGRLSSALKDDALSIKTIGQTSNNAIQEFNKGYNKLQTNLRDGVLTTSQFKSRVNDLSRTISDKYNVSIKNSGQANYLFKNRVNDVNLALKEYGNMLRSTNRMMQRGTFSSEQSKMLTMTRNEVGRLVLGHEEYNKILEQGGKTARNAFTQVNDYLQKNYKSLGLSKEQVLSFNSAFKGWKSTFNSIGGNLDMITTRTGNYNKLLTTTTRSQRMQNYAMQVSALRYNAVGTMAGFVGGMLVQQLAMGFVEARIQAVQFEQQAQQMLKTSKLTTGEITKLTNAVKKYTSQNRKVNTQGLEYTVGQVTKLNNLSEKSAEKAIPVIADITNMMQLNGRTQEDAILAVNDALDGQFKRLQEIGVQGKEQLKGLGWTGKLESEKDVNSLLDALTKLGQRKGWSDLTKDVSTLDDAYRVLGNTIDDFLTPAMVSITPTIVSVIQGLGSLLEVFTKMPLPVQGVAAALLVLGTAFGKMEFEMLKSKIYGTEFFARLTGLDDGMYGVTQSVGAVTSAVNDEVLSFQEGTRALQNYHNSSMKSLMTFDEMSTSLNTLKEAEEALNVQRELGIAVNEEELVSNKAKQAELYIMRESSNAYASQKLALSNLNSERKLQISTLQQMTGLSKTETGLLLANTGMIDKTTGEVKNLTQGTTQFNNAISQVGLSSKNFNTGIRGVADGMKTAKGQSDKLKSTILGLAKAENLSNVASKMSISTEELYSSILSKKISKEGIETSLKKQGIAVTEAKTLALSAENEALALNSIENTRNNGILANLQKGIKNTITSIYQEVKALAVRAVAWAAANPAMAVAIGLATALAAVIGGTLLSSQMALTDSLKTFNTVLEESESKISELDKQIEKAQGQTKIDLIERRNQLQEEYNKVNTRSTYLTQQSEIALGKLNTERAKYNKLIAESNSGTNGSNTQMQSNIDSAISEYDRITNYVTRFGLTASERNSKLYNEQLGSLNGLKKGTKEYDDQVAHNTEQMEKYLQTQQDVVDAHNKMTSEDTFTRWGGYFDNWTAHMTMGLIEFDAEFENWTSNNRAKVIKFGDDLSAAWNSIDWEGIKSTILYWLNPANWITEGSNLILSALGLDTVSVEETKTLISTGLQTVVDTITYYLNPLNWFTDDGGAGIIQWWNTNIADPLSGVLSLFGVDLHIGGQQAGQNLKNGIANGSSGIDSEVQENLDPISWAIDKAKGVFGLKGNKAGQNIKSGVKSGSKNTSSPVQSEMTDINTIISNQGGHNWFQTASDVAGKIIQGIKNGLNRHSPGDAAKTVLAEMEDANMFMEEQGNVLHEKAVTVGQKIVDGMSNVQGLGQSLNVINDNNAIMASTNQAQTYTSQQYGAMTNTVTDAFGIMSDTANTDMNSVAMNNAAYLTKLNNDTKSNMTQVQTTTDSKLKTMQSTTVTATNNMTKAWNTMRNNIVNAASQIRNQSYSKFSSLQRSIAGFYRQIQSASFSGGLPAGEPNTNTLSSRTIRKRQSLSSGKIGYAGVNEDYLKLLDKKNRSEKDIEEFYLKYPQAIPPNKNAIAGSGIDANVHTNKQYSYAKNWSIKDPTMYGVLLNMGYKVDDFNGKSPRISTVTDFERIITQLFTAHPTHYEYYFNSQKSNAQAWASGGFNCYDGCQLVMEIANDLGFGAGMAHGSWNGIPHVSAVVGGRLFDTTQWQKRGVWRGASGVSFGGFAGAPDKGRRVKWSTAGRGRFAAGPGNNTTNNSNRNVVNVTVTGNTFIGEEEYKKQIETIAEDVFFDKMSVNPCIGI